MNYSVRPGASLEQINRCVERGIDAMFAAERNGEEFDIAFTFDENAPEYEARDGDIGEESNDDNDEVVEISNVAEGENISILGAEEQEKFVCTGCERNPCVFSEHQVLLRAFDQAEHGHLAVEDLPANNVRRKMLYRQLTLMLNGGPMGAGVRKPLPDCCVAAVRYMLPSENQNYMGYHAE
jgi:hypothetical protein